nr:TldD/PmbA family protein [Maliibacterium massiliense]
MITQDTMAAVLQAALARGGDFAEVFLEDTDSTVLTMMDGRIEQAKSGTLFGAGLRLIDGDASIYAYGNDVTPAGLLEMAKSVAASLDGLGRGRDIVLPPARRVRDAHAPSSPDMVARSMRPKAALVQRIDRAARSFDACIAQVGVTYTDAVRRIWVANSLGTYVHDEKVRTRAAIQAVARDARGMQTGRCGPGRLMAFGDFVREIDVEAAARQAARLAKTALEAPACPAGRMPVVIAGGFGGVLFHEACGHALEATSVARGASVFCGKLGHKIASDVVSAVDDGTIPYAWGSGNIDDEGNPTARNVLIERGVLKGYLVDMLGSRRMGMPANGCGRRQNYRYAPTSRMSNTFILPGRDNVDEMIATMGDGLYCKSMGGGSVNPATGAFNFAVQEGYLVRGGVIQHAVRGANLIGRGDLLLLDIDRVADDLSMDQGMCGSQSGSVPTNVGQPTIRVRAMTVGGAKEGDA